MTREEIAELLPFYANGRISTEDRAAVDAALLEDATLRDELEFLTSLRDQMQAEPVDSPGEIGLTQLMDRLDRAEPANLTRPPRLWQIAAGVLLAIALVQGAFLMSPGGDPSRYELAGDVEPTLTASFRPDVTEAELRAALLAAGVEIVTGPSALGLYGLAPLEGVDVDAARDALLETGIVESLQ